MLRCGQGSALHEWALHFHPRSQMMPVSCRIIPSIFSPRFSFKAFNAPRSNGCAKHFTKCTPHRPLTAQPLCFYFDPIFALASANPSPGLCTAQERLPFFSAHVVFAANLPLQHLAAAATC